jgi:DNA-binding MarR family transcriptional regulator
LPGHLLFLHGKIALLMAAHEQRLLAEWHALRERHALTTSALERALETEHELGVSEYEVLERLADDSCRMQTLCGMIHLSQSALSRVVGRLEAAGFVERAICPEDRRGIAARITPAGRARFEAARPTHRRVLREALGSEA